MRTEVGCNDGKKVVLSRHIPEGVIFTGSLDVGEEIVPGMLHFEDILFQSSISFLRGLVRGEIMIRKSTVEGEFSLHQAIVCGQLFCDNSKFHRDVDLRRAAFVRGSVHFENVAFEKEVILSEIEADSITLKKCSIQLERFRDQPTILQLNRIFVKKDLSLEGTELKNVDIIDLRRSIVLGGLDLRIKSEKPIDILVSSRSMAEKAHHSAPNWSVVLKQDD